MCSSRSNGQRCSGQARCGFSSSSYAGAPTVCSSGCLEGESNIVLTLAPYAWNLVRRVQGSLLSLIATMLLFSSVH